MLKPIVLKNGLTVVRIPKSGAKSFMTGLVVTSGSGMEEGYFPQGISHLIERLFWAGTDKHPSTRSLNLTLESIGGNFNSLTTQELTGYYLTVPDYHQFKAVSMLAEIIQRSYFDSRDIDREKKQLIDKIKQQSEGLEMEINYLAISSMYANSSLGLPVEGSIDTVSSITQENILEYLSHQYRPDRCYLILAGSFENKPLLELVDQEWSVWNPRSKKFIEPMDFHPEDVGELPRITYRQRGIGQTYMVVAFLLDEGLKPKILSVPEAPDSENNIDLNEVVQEYLTTTATLMLANALLGQGLSSRLWTKSVEEEMLFTRISSEIVKFKSTGFLQVFGLIENSQFSFGLESILSVLEAFKKTTVSINELTKAKEYLKGKLILEQEELLSQAAWQIETLAGTSLNFELQDLLIKIDEVEAVQIRSLCKDLFVPERMMITTLGTAKETRLVEKLIKKYLS